jgi:protein-S-isoprenylcysteine O-methyltransferase Ste14
MPINTMNIYLIMGVGSFVAGPVLLACMAIVLQDEKKEAGLKSALLEFVLGIISAALVFCASMFEGDSILEVYGWVLLCVTAALVLWYMGPYKQQKRTESYCNNMAAFTRADLNVSDAAAPEDDRISLPKKVN